MVTLIPYNTPPYFDLNDDFTNLQMFNYEEMTYKMPKCLDIDERDNLTAAYNFTLYNDETELIDSQQFTLYDYVNSVLEPDQASLNFMHESHHGEGIVSENERQFYFDFKPNEIAQVRDKYEICMECWDDDTEGQGVQKYIGPECFEIMIEGFNHEPVFKSDFEDQELNVGEEIYYMMPSYTDEDPLDGFIEEILLSTEDPLPSWLTFNSNGDGTGLQMDIIPSLQAYAGDWKIVFTVTDTDSERSGEENSVEQSFTVTVIGNGTDTDTSDDEDDFDY
jgi:hypothetical protein